MKFDDGGEYVWKLPKQEVSGLLIGKRVAKWLGEIVVTDKKNNL